MHGVTASSESDASRSRGILLRGRGTNVWLLGPSGSVNTSASVDESYVHAVDESCVVSMLWKISLRDY